MQSSVAIQPGPAGTAAKAFTPLQATIHGPENICQPYQRAVPTSADVAAVLLTRWATPHTRLLGTATHRNAAGSLREQTFFSYRYNPQLFEVPQDPFCSLELSNVPLHTYVDRLLTHLCPGESLYDIVPVALRLIDRYHTATRGTMTHRNVHLIFGVAMMTAVKLLCESRMLRLSSYAHILGVSNTDCLRTQEVILLFECRWNLLPTPDEYACYAGLLMAGTGTANAKNTHYCETEPSFFPSPSDTRSVGSGVSCDMFCLSNSSHNSTTSRGSENNAALKSAARNDSETS